MIFFKVKNVSCAWTRNVLKKNEHVLFKDICSAPGICREKIVKMRSCYKKFYIFKNVFQENDSMHAKEIHYLLLFLYLS